MSSFISRKLFDVSSKISFVLFYVIDFKYDSGQFVDEVILFRSAFAVSFVGRIVKWSSKLCRDDSEDCRENQYGLSVELVRSDVRRLLIVSL